MSRAESLVHEFVEYVPDELAEGVLYVSIPFATAVHRCCCGCGNEVVTPFTPTDWQLSFDGETVSLHPSIGNWSFDCQSHYWIRRNQVRWAERWSPEQIAAGRARDRARKVEQSDDLHRETRRVAIGRSHQSLLRRVARWLRRGE